MPFIVTHRQDGSTNFDAGTLVHDGQEYDGPLFDVPVHVAEALSARHGFRYASAEDVEAAKPKTQPKKAQPRKRAE